MLDAIEFAAVLVSGIYGVLRATRKHLDVVGVVSLAFAVAFGGGTLRDLFLDRHPLFWIQKDYYLILVFGLGVIGAMIPQYVERIEPLLPIPDALGLGLFSIAGAAAAVDFGTSLFVASILGVITGTFGGVIGDVICNEIPSLFRPSPLYATCALAGAWTYLLLDLTILPEAVSLTAGIVVTVAMRLAALRWDIHIPAKGPSAKT